MDDKDLQIANLMNEIDILRDAIASHGCGIVWHETQDGREADCDHGYTWTCEECPCQKEPKS